MYHVLLAFLVSPFHPMHLLLQQGSIVVLRLFYAVAQNCLLSWHSPSRTWSTVVHCRVVEHCILLYPFMLL